LPASPNAGDSIDIFDYSETFDTNPLTIARNGQRIESLEENLVCNVEGAYFTIIYGGSTNGWQMRHVVPSRELAAKINAEMPIEPIDPNYIGEVAERWRYLDGSGEVGFISSVTQAFCKDCTRARLSAEGKLFTCLFATEGTDFRALIRSDASDDEISEALARVGRVRADRYSEIRTEETAKLRKVEMSYIGG
jgi:cyclic pyranopterin phosphate synthase